MSYAIARSTKQTFAQCKIFLEGTLLLTKSVVWTFLIGVKVAQGKYLNTVYKIVCLLVK